MNSRTCGQCVHFRPVINPATKRALISSAGSCAWSPPDFEWSMAYTQLHRHSDPLATVSRGGVWNKQNADDCKTFKAKT